MHHPQCLRLFATLRLRGRLGRDGCQSALWDCFGGQIWHHDENASPQNCPTMHLTTILTRSPAQPQSGELLHYFFLAPWWHEVQIFSTLTPVAKVAITVCIFPRKRAPVARFTALNNLAFHHRSPGTEPCYKFLCRSNRLHRLHIAHGTGHMCFASCLLLGCRWGQRSIKNNPPPTSKKDKMANGTPGFCVSHQPTPLPPFQLLWADFCGEGTGHFRSSGEQLWKSI